MKTFITEKNGFAGRQIEAFDFGHAQQQVWDEPGLEVVGELILTIQCEGFTERDADKMCKAFAEES